MYKLLSAGSVLRTEDGAVITFDDRKSDYAAYKDWLAAGNTPQPMFNEVELQQQAALNKQNNIAILWQAAHDYEYARINGMAIGLLTAGVLQKLPKSLAIQQWSKSIWDLYYLRKALVTSMLDLSFQDFSSVGPMPYSISELMSELGL